MFAAQIRKKRAAEQNFSKWAWHLDEVFGKINGELHCLWRAVDRRGEILEDNVAKRRECSPALKFLRRMMK